MYYLYFLYLNTEPKLLMIILQVDFNLSAKPWRHLFPLLIIHFFKKVLRYKNILSTARNRLEFVILLYRHIDIKVIYIA